MHFIASPVCCFKVLALRYCGQRRGARPKTSFCKIQSNDSCHGHLDNTVTTGLAMLSSSMKATGLAYCPNV